MRRGVTVRLAREGFVRARPVLEPHAGRLFKGLDVWAFGKDSGPRIWYGDPTIRAYDARQVVWESDRWVVRDPSRRRSRPSRVPKRAGSR